MRVIAGQFRSRPLVAPTGRDTRPTSDRLRETLFNVLTPRIKGAVFLDLYAGSGAVGIEALSRGARQAVFVEKDSSALHTIRANLASLGIHGGYALEARSTKVALRHLATTSDAAFNVIFLDPPYADAEKYESTLKLLGGEGARLVAPEGIVIAEHLKKHELADCYGVLHRYRTLKQGDSALSFYTPQ